MSCHVFADTSVWLRYYYAFILPIVSTVLLCRGLLLSPSASGASGTFGCRMYPRQTPMPRLWVTCDVLLGCVRCIKSIVTRSTVCMARYTKHNLNRPIADDSLVECLYMHQYEYIRNEK